jgi:Tol biopolymer transport system component
MNKHFAQPILKFFLLFVLAFSSGCGPVTTVPSPTIAPSATLTPTLTQTPKATATVTPSPTNTSEPIHPEGILFYSDYRNIFAVNLQSQKAKIIFTFPTIELANNLIVGNDIYIINNNADKPPYLAEIIKTNPDGTNVEKLLPTANKYWPLYCGQISPNKRYLLCYYGQDPISILVVDTETRSIQTIPQENNHAFLSISWSPDSQKIYLLDAVNVSSLHGVPRMGLYEQGRLLEFSLKANKLSELLPTLPNPLFRWGSQTPIVGWSPDGTNLLINLTDTSRELTDNFDRPYIYIFHSSNKEMEQVEVGGRTTHFEWSPDGTKIAFKMYVDNNGPDNLSIYDIASGNLQKIPVEGSQVYDFAWSPRGDYILYSVFTFQDPRNGIYLLDVFDNNSVQIMPNKKYSYTMRARDFIWSPSGNLALFIQEEQETADESGLYLFDLNTKTVVLIEKQSMDHWVFSPMWSSDGKYFLFFTGYPTGTLNIENTYNTTEHIEIKVPGKSLLSSDNVYWIHP